LRRSERTIHETFDIDGTILLTDGAGTRAANRAFEKVHGLRDAMKGIDAAGKTTR
jgi:hypothetical protein